MLFMHTFNSYATLIPPGCGLPHCIATLFPCAISLTSTSWEGQSKRSFDVKKVFTECGSNFPLPSQKYLTENL